jgi:hypothetical protein
MDLDRLDLVILAAAGVALVASLAAAHDWPGGAWVRRSWRRIEPYAGCYVKRSPATFTYAGIIAVTTWVVAGLSTRESDLLLRSQSTNLHNLHRHPLTVLFRSAFWSGGTAALPVIAMLAVVLAPAEVWLGTGRLILAFAVGHLGATLITAVALSNGYFGSPGSPGVARTIDVGVSYGVLCVAGLLTYRLPLPLRLPYAVGLLTTVGLFAFVFGRTFTDFGHVVSVLIGLASYPLARNQLVEERARIPLYRPWLAPGQDEVRPAGEAPGGRAWKIAGASKATLRHLRAGGRALGRRRPAGRSTVDSD